MSSDLLPGPGVEWRITPLPNGGHTRTVTTISPAGGYHRTVTTFLPKRRGGGGYTTVVAAVEAINVPAAGLKRQKHGDDDDGAVSGQAKRRRRRRGTGGDKSTTDEHAAATATAAAQAACAICLEVFQDGDDLAVMPCAHRFHEGCLIEWLALSLRCPCCRHALPSDGDGEGKGEAPHAVTVSSLAAGATGGFQDRARRAATTRSRRARQANSRL